MLPPLSGHALPATLLDDARVVVLVVVDGFSAEALRRDDGLTPAVAPAHHGILTSVFPSTTAAALTSLQYGMAPGAHGMAGYTIFLPSAGRLVNLVRFKSVDGGSIDPRYLNPRKMVTQPSMYERLRKAGVESVVVSHKDYAGSPLTEIHSGDTPYRGHRTAAEFAAMLRSVSVQPGRRFVFGYWAGLDMVSHAWGPGSATARLEARLVQQALVEGFLRPLADEGGDVVVILTADHGHATIADERQMPLSELSRLAGSWMSPATGERRAVGLTPQASGESALREATSGDGAIVTVDEAVAHGLYGPPPHHPELVQRIGRDLLLAKDGASFPYRSANGDGKPFASGAHGSLTAVEMVVPLLVWRFGSNA